MSWWQCDPGALDSLQSQRGSRMGTADIGHWSHHSKGFLVYFGQPHLFTAPTQAITSPAWKVTVVLRNPHFLSMNSCIKCLLTSFFCLWLMLYFAPVVGNQLCKMTMEIHRHSSRWRKLCIALCRKVLSKPLSQATANGAKRPFGV